MVESLANKREEVRRRFANRSAEQPLPQLPFCLDAGDGKRLDAMRQVRGTLAGLLTIVLLLAAGIAWIFTTGTVLMVLLGAAGLCLLAWLLHCLVMRRAGARWRREALPFPATLVMAHSSVYEPGQSIVPGVLLVDFGGAPDAERMMHAAAAAAATTEGGVPPAHRELSEWLLAGMRRGDFGRVRVPRDLAGNDSCWLISLRFDRNSMPNGHVDRQLWFVLARPDCSESAELLPHCYWVDA